jgi:putative DNA primase/helicase
VTDNVVKLAALQETAAADTEDSIALAFADRHAAELRYVAKLGQWLSYTGTRWVPDETMHTFDRARALCRRSAQEQGRGHVTASAKTVAAVERLAKSDRRLAATVDQWDADIWSLNTGGSNGTSDL